MVHMSLTMRLLARVIAASSEDSHLDAQLSIAKAFTLPVFRAEAKNTGRKAFSIQGSSASSASTSGSGGLKRKASSPGRYRNKKSPRRGSSPASKRGRGRK